MADSNDDQKTASEAERDVEAARANLAGSINSLEARLSPDALVEQGIAYFQGNGRRHLDTLVRNAQANPIPLVLIGIGVAWLAMGSNRTRSASQGAFERHVPENRLYDRDDDRPASNTTPSSSGLGATDASTMGERPRTTGGATSTSATRSGAPGDPLPSSSFATDTDSATADDPLLKDDAITEPVGSKPATNVGTATEKGKVSLSDPIGTAHSDRDKDK